MSTRREDQRPPTDAGERGALTASVKSDDIGGLNGDSSVAHDGGMAIKAILRRTGILADPGSAAAKVTRSCAAS